MEEGTIVHVDYELYNGESGDLIETTREEVAKEHEAHQEGRSYSPMVCVVGGGNLIPGFEAALADGPIQRRLNGRRGFIDIVPVEAQPRLEPQRIARAEADRFDLGLHQQRFRETGRGIRRHRDLEPVLAGIA